MNSLSRFLLPFATLALLAQTTVARCEDHSKSAFGDVQVSSGTDATEISLEVLGSLAGMDRTQTRPGLSAGGRTARVLDLDDEARELRPATASPGALTVGEIHLFFPGATIDRARLITVDDRIIQEARLFPDEGGVSMTVVVRRPVYYALSRARGALRIHVEPGTLLVAEPTGQEPERPAVKVGPKAPKTSGGRGGSSPLLPTLTLPQANKGEGLTVDAEHLSADQEKNEIVAQGHVTIARAGSLLTADEVRIQRDTQRAVASGNVQFTDPQGTIQADSFAGNLEDETGVLTNGTVYLKSNHLTISGAKLEKSYGQTYHIENGEFTTCRCGAGPPSWSIAGKSIDVTLNGYGLVEGAKLKVLDVPILYLPLAAFPAKTTRQTGLLAPQFAYSRKRGFVYTQPLFVVLNKSADFTIAPDVETSARIGAVGEFRWALGERSKGVLDAAYYNEALRNNADRDVVDSTIADPHIPEDRWSVTANVEEEMPFGVRAFADSLAVSDDLYLREIRNFSFDPEYERRLSTSRFSSSRGGLYKSWEHATLITQAVYYQDFIQEDDLTLQRLPDIEIFASDRFLDRHLKVGVNGELVDFVRKKGFDGPRLDVAPSAQVPFRWQEYVRGNLGLQLRETAYHLTNTELVQPVSQAGGVQQPVGLTSLDKNPTREIFLGSAMIGTQLARVFDVGGEHVQKLKHTIEPEVDYLYVPDVDQNHLPIFDFVDRINRRSLLSYGFTTRLLAKLDQPPPIEAHGPLTVGDLNPFRGGSPSAIGDENTRSGLGSLGLPDASSLLSGGSEAAAAEVTEAAKATPEDRAARSGEEKSALSHVVEWARLQIFQSYDLRDSLQTGKNDHQSDVDIHLRVSPVAWFNLIYDSTVNVSDSKLTSANVGLLLRDPRAREAGGFLTAAQRASLGVSYRLISDGVLQEVDGSVVVPFADTLSAFYLTSYDALQKTFLQRTAGLRLSSQCQCWIADVAVDNRVNPDETVVRFQLTLVGLGSIGRAN